MQKRQTLDNGFALLENDITGFLPAPKLKIHSSNLQLRDDPGLNNI